MYIDSKLEFADAEAIASMSAGSAIAEYVRDLGASEVNAFGTSITPDIGEGGKLIWHTNINVAMVGASSIMTANLVTKAANATLTTSGTTIASVVFPAASAAGTKRSVAVPQGAILRYLGVVWTVSAAKLTSGTFDSFINMDMGEKHD